MVKSFISIYVSLAGTLRFLTETVVSAVRNVRFTYAKPKEHLCLFLFRLAGFQVFGERRKEAFRIRV